MLHRAILPLAAVATLLSLAGCGLPFDGPRGEAVFGSAAAHVDDGGPNIPFCLVTLTPRITSLLVRSQPRLAGRFTDRRGATPVLIGVGDVVRVTLFESAAGGLFFPLEGGSRTGNFLVIPDQHVDADGNITVPYAGQIRASGRTAVQVQNAIVDALKNRALEPQAVVTVTEQRDALISVFGEVNTAGRVPASASGERVLDAISRAGGLKGPGQETWVLLERKGRVAVTPFSALIHEPVNNIYVRPRDTLYVFREPQTFLAFGAVTQQGQVPFGSWKMSLAEGIARAGGLLDERAEPAWVFLFRPEPKELAAEMDPACVVHSGRYMPVVYQVNLRDPATYFLATQVPMRNKDLILVSNARGFEIAKFATYVRAVTSAIQDPVDSTIGIYTLRGVVRGSANVIVGTGTP